MGPADWGEALVRLQAVRDVVTALLPDPRGIGGNATHHRSYHFRGSDAQLQAYVLQQCAVRAKYS